MVRLLTLTIALLVPLQTPEVNAQTLSDNGQVEAFLGSLQRAVEADDRSAVAAMIRYPVTAAIGGFRVPFPDAASFLTRYEDIFNPPLRDAIARASLYAKPGGLQMTAVPHGYAIDTNVVVMTETDGQLRITSIAVPEFAGDPAPGVAPSVDKAVLPGRPAEPRRIAIRVGPRATQIPGTLVSGATDTFLLYLPKGKLASVRLERVPAGTATVRVVHAASGTSLGTRTSSDGRFVSGRSSEGGDYRVEVRKTGDADSGHLPYMLSLTLR